MIQSTLFSCRHNLVAYKYKRLKIFRHFTNIFSQLWFVIAVCIVIVEPRWMHSVWKHCIIFVDFVSAKSRVWVHLWKFHGTSQKFSTNKHAFHSQVESSYNGTLTSVKVKKCLRMTYNFEFVFSLGMSHIENDVCTIYNRYQHEKKNVY